MPGILGKLDRRAAAERIRQITGRCEPSTLAKAAHAGSGPLYELINGRAYYRPEDCDAYANSLISPPICRASDARKAGVAA